MAQFEIASRLEPKRLHFAVSERAPQPLHRPHPKARKPEITEYTLSRKKHQAVPQHSSGGKSLGQVQAIRVQNSSKTQRLGQIIAQRHATCRLEPPEAPAPGVEKHNCTQVSQRQRKADDRVYAEESPLELPGLESTQDLRRRLKRNRRRTKLLAHILIQQTLFKGVDGRP